MGKDQAWNADPGASGRPRLRGDHVRLHERGGLADRGGLAGDDLDQSIRVDEGTNTVFVEPSVVLRVDRNGPKEMVVVGEVKSVNETRSELVVEMQTLAGQRITDANVSVPQMTVYQLNGVPFPGH